MKLRNKKTGQLGNFIINKDHFECVDLDYVPEYRNLAELNAEWQDYEEPKEYWFIDAYGNIVQNKITKHRGDTYTDMTDLYENQKQIGNYFATAEEAKQAVEKLHAWKRLKDKGFGFDGWTIDDGLKISICTNFEGGNIYSESEKEIKSDLDICFGGEE